MCSNDKLLLKAPSVFKMYSKKLPSRIYIQPLRFYTVKYIFKFVFQQNKFWSKMILWRPAIDFLLSNYSLFCRENVKGSCRWNPRVQSVTNRRTHRIRMTLSSPMSSICHNLKKNLCYRSILFFVIFLCFKTLLEKKTLKDVSNGTLPNHDVLFLTIFLWNGQWCWSILKAMNGIYNLLRHWWDVFGLNLFENRLNQLLSLTWQY